MVVSPFMGPSEIRFAADRMLGRLARLLRLLGYDSLYSSQMTVEELREIGRRRERVLLTRGDAGKRFPGFENVLSLKSQFPPEQLRQVVGHFKLDTRSGLWTRCTLCNGLIQNVEKGAVEPLVPPKVFGVYDQFFRCADCGHVYWRGSHVERILKNLAELLGEVKDESPPAP